MGYEDFKSFVVDHGYSGNINAEQLGLVQIDLVNRLEAYHLSGLRSQLPSGAGYGLGMTVGYMSNVISPLKVIGAFLDYDSVMGFAPASINPGIWCTIAQAHVIRFL